MTEQKTKEQEIRKFELAAAKIKGQKKIAFAGTWLLSLLEQNPQIIKPGIGMQAFVTDLLKANEAYHRSLPATIGAIGHLQPFLKVCPHIFQPGTGIESLVEQMIEAAECFYPYYG